MLYTIGLDVFPTVFVCISLPNPYPNPISLLLIYSIFAQPKLPDNMLYNIGLDVAPTDLVCISPPGVIFEKKHSELLEKQLHSRDINLENTEGARNLNGIYIYFL
jgi:hypothetical protein